MSLEISDLRKGVRFNCTHPLNASFNGWEVTLSNLSLGGAQIVHAEPVKIGTRSRITLPTEDGPVSIGAQVIWCRLAQSEGKLLYRTGLKLAAAEPRFALALNAMIRNGNAQADRESLERKRERALEREEQLARAKVSPLPSALPHP
ncbi:MAG TPA: PilZ domain-containing protein [Thermoanaerobaculia bacterium]